MLTCVSLEFVMSDFWCHLELTYLLIGLTFRLQTFYSFVLVMNRVRLYMSCDHKTCLVLTRLVITRHVL